ncbi:MAG: hypothetical protein HC904_16865 [Blastochloris sp.]|nr:hypothetical protein [Blastochloris sp.]
MWCSQSPSAFGSSGWLTTDVRFKNEKIYLSLALVVVTLSLAIAESYPGYRYAAKFSEERIASDNPDFATIFARLTDDTLAEQDVAIRYEVKTRQVISARWMTKGHFEFQLPKMGLYVPQRPSEEKKMLLMLSVEKITDIREQKMALVGIYWGDGPK